MHIGKIEVKRRVWAGLGFALSVTGAWWVWMQSRPPVVVVAERAQPPFVRFAGAGTGVADQVLRERADLFDPTPLFFPTEWNYGQQPLRDNLRRQPGQVFGSYEPVYSFAETSMKPYGAEARIPSEKLSDVLSQGNEAPFAGFGQIDAPRPALPGRAGFLEVTGFAAVEPIIAQALEGISVPRVDYAPMEFLLMISSAGIVGDPVQTSGSGWEEVDVFFRSYLVKTARLGERLSPGRYRVLIGP
ncbi:MAG: hypothetical protein HYX71_09445 [Opitutae bacterium]|nr:hypothetical protein [Opitutae bacterium]